MLTGRSPIQRDREFREAAEWKGIQKQQASVITKDKYNDVLRQIEAERQQKLREADDYNYLKSAYQRAIIERLPLTKAQIAHLKDRFSVDTLKMWFGWDMWPLMDRRAGYHG